MVLMSFGLYSDEYEKWFSKQENIRCSDGAKGDGEINIFPSCGYSRPFFPKPGQ
jgi:hypothetical protein